MINTKKNLEIKLSKLKGMSKKDIRLEQYESSSVLVSELLWYAYILGDIKGKKVLDAGCGNGIFGAGCLLLGAKRVYFLDIDSKMIALAKENSPKGEFFCCDIDDFNINVDTVIMNPPFGVHKKNEDKRFLLKAFIVSNVIYSIHHYKSLKFLQKISSDNNFNLLSYERDVNLKRSYSFHTKDIKKTRVVICRFNRSIS